MDTVPLYVYDDGNRKVIGRAITPVLSVLSDDQEVDVTCLTPEQLKILKDERVFLEVEITDAATLEYLKNGISDVSIDGEEI